MYLYRAVDSRGQTIDFLLSARRDAEAAKRFFRKALAQPHTVNPRTITVDKNPAYPKAIAAMKQSAELWRFSRRFCCKDRDGPWWGRGSFSSGGDLEQPGDEGRLC